LRLPLTNDQKEFDEQVLALAKVFIDSLNEEELSRGLVLEKEKPKGIDKLEAFLLSERVSVPQMIEFMRNLQSLRSSSVVHRKGKNYEKVKQFFSIGEKELPAVFDEILVKAVYTLNTLEKCFLADPSNKPEFP
jgi:hypothetical protein